MRATPPSSAPLRRKRRPPPPESVPPAGPALHRHADGVRLLEAGFERFSTIAERAGREAVVAEALRLAEIMVERLARVGGPRQNALIDGRSASRAMDGG